MRMNAFDGIRPIRRNIWFSVSPVDPGNWPATPWMGSAEPREVPVAQAPAPELGQSTIPVFNWPGHTALVLGPSSWGFGIGVWPGTAQAVGAPRFPFKSLWH